jgi:hypothetical protein
VPGIGQINDAGQVGEVSFGKWIESENLSDEDKQEFRNRMRTLALESEETIGDLPIGLNEANAMKAGWLETRNVLI